LIRLWGWGVLYCREGKGLFIERYLFMPQAVHAGGLAPRVWMTEQIAPRMPQDSTERAVVISRLAELCEWIDGYERSVRRACGLRYRIDCLVRWDKPIAVPANQMALRWREVNKRVKKHLYQGIHGPAETKESGERGSAVEEKEEEL
jgi:hypothetical protein